MEYQYCYSPYDGNVCNFNCRPKKANAPRPRPHEINLRILVGVTGSVAAIKLGELIDCLYALPSVKEIAVIPTERSEHFINSEELESLGSKHKKTDVKVWRDADEWSMWKGRGDPVLHIDLGKWADAMILAPLDANTLAKISHGLCDNLLTCVLRAWDLKKNKPVLFCPAMNTKMWEHPLTSMQIQSLQDFGYTYVPPIEKTLMCGDTGVGAMATVSTIANTFSEMIEERYGHNSAYNQPTCFGYLSNQENAGLFIHNFGHSSGAHEHNNGREHWANCQNHTEQDEEERAYRREESALYGDRSETSFNSAQEPRAPPNSGSNSKDYRNNDQSQMQNEPRHSTGSGNSHENSSKRSSFQASSGSSKNKKDSPDDTFSSNSQGKDPDKNSSDGHGETSDGLTSTITSFNPVAHSTAITEGKAGQTSTFDTVLSGEDSKDTNSTSTSSKKTTSSKTKTNTKTTPTSRKPGNQSNQSQIRAQAQTSGAVSSNISSFNPVAHSTAIEGKGKGAVTTTSTSTLGSAKSGKITKKKIAPAASQKPGNRSNQSKLQGNTNTFQTVSDQTSVEVSGISASSNTQESSGGSKIAEPSQGQTIHTSSSGETIAEVVATVAIHPKTGSVTSSKGGKSTQSSNKGSVGAGTEVSSGSENSTALGVEVNVEVGLESSTFESDNSKKDDSEEQTTGGDIEVNTELSGVKVESYESIDKYANI